MRARIFLCIWLLIASIPTAFSQVLMVEKAYEHLKRNELGKSLEAIEMASQHPSTAADPRTWYLKGFILKELFNTHTDTKIDYRSQALIAIAQCREIDKNQQFSEDCESISSFIYTSYFNDAIQQLNAGNYAGAITVLKPFVEDNTNAFYAEASYYSGYASLMQGQGAQADIFFQQALEAGFHDALIYDHLANNYLNNNPEKALVTIRQGRNLFPDDKGLHVSEVNILLALQEYTQAEISVENYLSKHPDDIEVMLVAGTVYEKLYQQTHDQKEAYLLKRKSIYFQILAENPDNVLANYNIGITLYNQAVVLINQQTDLYNVDLLSFDSIIEQCTSLFKEALPFIKKAHELMPDNINTLKALEGIYYNLNDREKIIQVRKHLNALKN
jgi:tetratricopeptide (TPR) repeat protein